MKSILRRPHLCTVLLMVGVLVMALAAPAWSDGSGDVGDAPSRADVPPPLEDVHDDAPELGTGGENEGDPDEDEITVPIVVTVLLLISRFVD